MCRTFCTCRFRAPSPRKFQLILPAAQAALRLFIHRLSWLSMEQQMELNVPVANMPDN